jgi:hypothetical protein
MKAKVYATATKAHESQGVQVVMLSFEIDGRFVTFPCPVLALPDGITAGDELEITNKGRAARKLLEVRGKPVSETLLEDRG